MNELKILTAKSKNIRKKILEITYKAKSSHVGSSLSTVELLTYIFYSFLDKKDYNLTPNKRNSILLSKGHAAASFYSTLSEFGYISNDELINYSVDGTFMTGHINSYIHGVDFSTGSLGHAPSVGVGISLASKKDGFNKYNFTIVSDGELNEGSVWEAIMFASHHKLDNFVMVVDCNKIQSFGFTKDVINMEPLEEKFKSFGCDVHRIDGHNFIEIENCFSNLDKNNKPKVIIADTIKGKGVSFMENKLEWHYKSTTEEELKLAIEELDKIHI